MNIWHAGDLWRTPTLEASDGATNSHTTERQSVAPRVICRTPRGHNHIVHPTGHGP